DGAITVSATFELPSELSTSEPSPPAAHTPAAPQRRTLWYRVPEQYGDALTPNCDPFAIATLLLAMRHSADLVVHGPVSPSLITNLEEFQAAWSCWRPNHYHRIAIHADSEQESPTAASGDRVISAFSGGVDSCYTALRHRRGLCGRLQRNLQAGMMVHGFDIPLKQTDAFAKAIVGSRVMLSSLGMDLIPVATNFRQVIKLDWEDAFGTAIASCLTLFSNHYRAGLIPGSYSYHALGFPYGSNPISDRLMSSQGFEIVHDGVDATRADKIRCLSSWDEALHHLRVCWEGEDKYRNCGRCEKCIRNILNFRIVGIDAPPCFSHAVTNAEIRAMRVKNAQLDALTALWQSAKTANISDPWVGALEHAIRRNRQRAQLESYIPPALKQQLKQLPFLSKR
ncbi:MAG TPA: hypothetical protein V6C88_21580, partial [Chroococcidiopsis sp.]